MGILLTLVSFYIFGYYCAFTWGRFHTKRFLRRPLRLTIHFSLRRAKFSRQRCVEDSYSSEQMTIRFF